MSLFRGNQFSTLRTTMAAAPSSSSARRVNPKAGSVMSSHGTATATPHPTYSSPFRLKNQIGTIADSTMITITIPNARKLFCAGKPTFMP